MYIGCNSIANYTFHKIIKPVLRIILTLFTVFQRVPWQLLREKQSVSNGETMCYSKRNNVLLIEEYPLNCVIFLSDLPTETA